MSDLALLGMFLAIGLGNMYIYILLERGIQEHSDAIVTGVVRGIPVPAQHRWTILQNSWGPAVAGLVVFESLSAVGYILIARYADAEEVRAFVYLTAFVTFMGGGIGVMAQGLLAYPRLKSLLRQAEIE